MKRLIYSTVAIQAKKADMSKYSSFSLEQRKEIKQGFENGVDADAYAIKDLDADSMYYFRLAMEEGMSAKDVKMYAKPLPDPDYAQEIVDRWISIKKNADDNKKKKKK